MTASMSTPHIQLAAWSSDAGMTGNKGRLNGRADPAAGKKETLFFSQVPQGFAAAS